MRSRRPLVPIDLGRTFRRVRRSPIVYWIAAGTLTLLAFSSFQSRSLRLDRTLAALGATTDALVMTADLVAGDTVGPDDVETRSLPVGIVPTGALRRLPPGSRLRVDASAGEVLVRTRLTGPGASRLAAAVPEGWRAIAVPLPPAGPRLEAGDRVDLLAIDADGLSTAIVEEAIVIDATGSGGDASAMAATIALPRRSLPLVADAVLATTLTVALIGSG